MADTYEQIMTKLHAEHHGEPYKTPAGWLWACSCKKASRSKGMETAAEARTALGRHLSAEYRRLVRAAR